MERMDMLSGGFIGGGLVASGVGGVGYFRKKPPLAVAYWSPKEMWSETPLIKMDSFESFGKKLEETNPKGLIPEGRVRGEYHFVEEWSDRKLTVSTRKKYGPPYEMRFDFKDNPVQGILHKERIKPYKWLALAGVAVAALGIGLAFYNSARKENAPSSLN